MHAPPPDPIALHQRACAGEEDALDALARHWWPQIRRWALMELGDAALADEASQETLVRLIRVADGFEAALAAAKARSDPEGRPSPVARWIGAAALAFAAAAALLLAARTGPTGDPATQRTTAAASAQAEPDLVRIGRGRTAILALPSAPKAVQVADPSVAHLVMLGSPERLQIQGVGVGRTRAGAILDDGAEVGWWFEVAADGATPMETSADYVLRLAEQHHTLRVGERLYLELDRVAVAVAVTDTERVSPGADHARRIYVDGRAAGTTDMVVQYGPDEPIDLFVFTVTD